MSSHFSLTTHDPVLGGCVSYQGIRCSEYSECSFEFFLNGNFSRMDLVDRLTRVKRSRFVDTQLFASVLKYDFCVINLHQTEKFESFNSKFANQYELNII